MKRSRIAAQSLACWCGIFAVLHLYWAFGGRAGLGDESERAEAALATTWFAAYNLTVVVLSVSGILVAVAMTSTVSPGTRQILRRAVLVAAVVLLARGSLGVSLLIFDTASRSSDDNPLILTLIEPWFLLGGVLCLWCARTRRPVPPTNAP